MTLNKLKPGMVVYDVQKYLMGNTTIRTTGVWEVRIVSVDEEKHIVTASWNGNPVKKYYRHDWSRWRLKEPVLIKGPWGYERIATRKELKAMKAK